MGRFLEALTDRVLLCDGAMGSRVQDMNLDVEKDFWGKENCTDVLNLSRPDVVTAIHKDYFAAGADMVETNSFGGSPITLAEFDLQEHAYEINKRAAELAREAAASFGDDGRERFVLGSVGPGTRLPSLGHETYGSLEQAFVTQCTGLLAGGVDAILIETCQDPLQIKAAVNGAKIAAADLRIDEPTIIVQVTIETTGTLLVGSDIAAAATIIRALDVPVMGLNCATGPQEMAPHVKWLAENWTGPISVLPNAGLPELVDGATRYPLAPDELAKWLGRFLAEDGVNMIGGCCGTTTEHIAAVDAMLRRRAGDEGRTAGRVSGRPAPVERSSVWVPGLASLYGQVAYAQENAYLSIGERCNANGSKRFRQYQEQGDWDACVAMGVEQAKEGSHAIDVCTAFVGRDEAAEIAEVIIGMRGAVNAPLVIDSTEYPVLEKAMALYGGKAVLNSINFEDGEEPAVQRVKLARKFGAAVIALTIDEGGMAKEADHKVAVAQRLYDFACGKHGLPPEDLIFDPLTFTICTGNEDDRKLGLWTLEAIEKIADALPDCQIVLGLSNISFGLNPAARHVLNSVFLDHAIKRGLSGAIAHVGKILPLHSIAEEELKTAEDLIFDRRRDGYDPLHAFIALFEGRTAETAKKRERAADVETRLKDRIVDGDRQGLENDLDEALKKYPPLDIVNVHLLDGMKVVGELFGSGKMQLPFVLRSAETMKAAVSYLEPHMEKVEGQEKGIIVLATVKGDVHDIGKNLVDIILTNNGYKVINLGIKQPVEAILSAVREHSADAIGMSGLLVKSTVVMRENLERLSKEAVDVPVLLGGAALTRNYVEGDCVGAYTSGRVAYARDAFDGLSLMEKIAGEGFDDYVQAQSVKQASKGDAAKRGLGRPSHADPRPVDLVETRIRRQELGNGIVIPEPPFWGPRVLARMPVDALLPFLNERMLFQFQWGYRKNGRKLDDYMAWARSELRPIVHRVLDDTKNQDILLPQAVYGYWPANAEGNDIIVYDPDDRAQEIARFSLPRQGRDGGLCIADFLCDVTTGKQDVLGLQIVTIGQKASDAARQWFAEDRYQDYLYLHGLGVELAEALAEYVHKRIRGELGFSHEDDRDPEKMLQQGYRGARYSFGYPACPNLEDQNQLLRLLQAEQIGVVMSDEFQLHPEQSTSAIVLHHPQARYFTV